MLVYLKRAVPDYEWVPDLILQTQQAASDASTEEWF